jgi:hypothetical protein
LLLVSPAGAHTLPSAGDHFSYTETIALTNGNGNYSGYTEAQFINGSLSVGSVLPNGTDSVQYQNTNHYVNNQGQTQTNLTTGAFTFSATSYHYVQGTDNQTGYVDPYVWFYMNNSLTHGDTFYLLNSAFTVVSTSGAFPLASSSTGYVRALFAEGNGTFERNDIYGAFNASYNWKAYFDPATGYIIGYVYTEQDADGSGDGFTWTDTLSVTGSSYALTPTSAPAPATSSSFPWVDVVVAVVVVVLLVAILAVALRRRSGPALPRHSVQGAPNFGPPSYGGPAPLNFGGAAQPSVQQIVIKETVKVNCQYCGTLIDSTATVCPKCGAPRT